MNILRGVLDIIRFGLIGAVALVIGVGCLYIGAPIINGNNDPCAPPETTPILYTLDGQLATIQTVSNVKIRDGVVVSPGPDPVATSWETQVTIYAATQSLCFPDGTQFTCVMLKDVQDRFGMKRNPDYIMDEANGTITYIEPKKWVEVK